MHNDIKIIMNVKLRSLLKLRVQIIPPITFNVLDACLPHFERPTDTDCQYPAPTLPISGSCDVAGIVSPTTKTMRYTMWRHLVLQEAETSASRPFHMVGVCCSRKYAKLLHLLSEKNHL